MAIAEVGSGTQRNSNSIDSNVSLDVAFPGNVTSGNLVIVCGGFWNISDAASVTTSVKAGSTATCGAFSSIFSTGLSWAGGFGHAFLNYALVTGTGSLTITIAPSTGSGNYINGAVDEFSGIHATPLDVNGGQASWGPFTSGTPTDTITTITANDLIVGVIIGDSGFNFSLDPGTGYTQIAEDQTSDRQSYGAEFRIVTTATTYNVDWSMAAGADRSGFIINAAFKEATAAAVDLIGAFMMA